MSPHHHHYTHAHTTTPPAASYCCLIVSALPELKNLQDLIFLDLNFKKTIGWIDLESSLA